MRPCCPPERGPAGPGGVGLALFASVLLVSVGTPGRPARPRTTRRRRPRCPTRPRPTTPTSPRTSRCWRPQPADAAVAKKSQAGDEAFYEKWQFWAVTGGVVVGAVALVFGGKALYHSLNGGDVRPCNPIVHRLLRTGRTSHEALSIPARGAALGRRPRRALAGGCNTYHYYDIDVTFESPVTETRPACMNLPGRGFGRGLGHASPSGIGGQAGLSADRTPDIGTFEFSTFADSGQLTFTVNGYYGSPRRPEQPCTSGATTLTASDHDHADGHDHADRTSTTTNCPPQRHPGAPTLGPSAGPAQSSASSICTPSPSSDIRYWRSRFLSRSSI